jgi:hypothetical protein
MTVATDKTGSPRAKSRGVGTAEGRASTEFILSAAAGGAEGLGTNEIVGFGK